MAEPNLQPGATYDPLPDTDKFRQMVIGALDPMGTGSMDPRGWTDPSTLVQALGGAGMAAAGPMPGPRIPATLFGKVLKNPPELATGLGASQKHNALLDDMAQQIFRKDFLGLADWQKASVEAEVQANLPGQAPFGFTEPKKPALTSVGKTPKDVALDTGDMQQVGPQLGSNPGGIYRHPTGDYYVKQLSSEQHAKNELLAAKLAERAGARTLQYRKTTDPRVVASELQPLEKKSFDELSQEEKNELKHDFAIHAWLGNWDALGLHGDNVGTIDGKPTWLDFGGALRFRAQGAPKERFDRFVPELETMRDPNRSAGRLFAGMTDQEVRSSISSLSNHMRPVDIANVFEKYGQHDLDLRDILNGRIEDLTSMGRMLGGKHTPEQLSAPPSMKWGDPGFPWPAGEAAERAKEGGYTTPVFRGVTAKNYPSVNIPKRLEMEYAPGSGTHLVEKPPSTVDIPSTMRTRHVYTSENPDLALMYGPQLEEHPNQATLNMLEGAIINPQLLATKDYHVVDARGRDWSMVNSRAIKDAQDLGKKGVIVKNVYDEPSSSDVLGRPTNVYITFNTPEGGGGATMRSSSAMFDPSKFNISDLLAGLGGGAILPWLGAEPKRSGSPRN